MFRIQNWKQALGLMALGSFFTIIGLLLSPVTAQKDKFDTIQCKRLEVVDDDGEARVIIDTNEHGGEVAIYGKGGLLRQLWLGVHEHGGIVSVRGKEKGIVMMRINEHGGSVAAHGNYGKGTASMGTNERGGYVRAIGKGEGAAVMGIDEHGGRVSAGGKDGKGTASMGTNEYGNGGVITYDKNGIARELD